MVNAALTPMPWPLAPCDADDDFCPACNERYQEFNSGVQWCDGRALIKDHGFKSRGPVLWAMRVLKLSAWRYRHGWCVNDRAA